MHDSLGHYTARTVDRAPDGGGDGDGLLGSTAVQYLQPGSACVIARESPDAGLSGPQRPLLNPETVIASSERPTVILGRNPYRKSQTKRSKY